MRGTIRYWAAAKAAAGVAEEPYDGITLADALDAARTRHPERLPQVLERCSFIVDGVPVGARAHDAVALHDGGVVEVLPPFAGGAEVVLPDTGGRPLLTGLVTALLAGVLMAAAHASAAVLAIVVLVVQVLLTLAWLAALGAAGGLGAFAVVAAAAVAADAALVAAGGARVDDLVGVVGIAMAGSLLHQVARRRRSKVTLSVAATMSAVVLAVAAATYVALRSGVDGRAAVAAGLAGVGAAVLVARLVDAVLPRPIAVPRGSRGWPGLLLGVAAAFGAGLAYGALVGGIQTSDAWAIALAAGAVGLAADLAVDAGAIGVTLEGDTRQRSALVPTAMFLPLALAAPAAYVTGRILLG